MFFFKKSLPFEEKRKRTRKDLGKGYYYTYIQCSNGIGGYAIRDLWLFHDRKRKFARCIIDEAGIIQSFPGFEKGEWIKLAEYPLENRQRFSFSIAEFSDGKAQVRWMFQPDGWYYADSQGYGKEKDEEIVLYSYIDEKGNFLMPFYP